MNSEEEAAEKICWHTRGYKEPQNCIGSVCMAWKWTNCCRHVRDDFSKHPEVWHRPWSENSEWPRLGYCGLTGEAS